MMTRQTTFLLVLLAVSARGGQIALTFEKDVRPILKAHCTHCHGEEEKPKGELDLRLRRFMDKVLEGGEHVLAPGRPDESEMVQLIRRGEMPKKGKKVSEADVAIIEQWIAQGAKTLKPEPLTLAPGPLISDEDRGYWAFQPVKRPLVPAEVDAKKVRTPVDAFVLRSMRGKGLDFAP